MIYNMETDNVTCRTCMYKNNFSSVLRVQVYYQDGRECKFCISDCKNYTTGTACDICKSGFILKEDKTQCISGSTCPGAQN